MKQLILTTIEAPVITDPLNGAMRRYRNRNWTLGGGAGKWLFGVLPDRYSGDGLQWVWTEDENAALADNGEVADMLGLGSGKAASASMVSASGTSGAAATVWDAILIQVPGGTHASSLICRRSHKRPGGKFDAIRKDGARLELQSFW